MQVAEGSLLKRAAEQIKEARKEMMDVGWKANPSMNKTLASPLHLVAGWNGEMVEAWRIESWNGVT